MNILIVAPHMDDEVLGMGGTIAKHVDNGDEVCVIIVTDRVYNHSSNFKLLDEDKLQAINAKKILGYNQIFFLGLADEKLDSLVQEIIIPLEEQYNNFLPDIVYTCHFGDNNQDHRAVFDAVRVVTRQAQKAPPSKVFLYETPSSTEQSPPLLSSAFIPNYFVNIENFLNQKVLALQCYKNEIKDYPHPRSIEGVTIYAQFRGIQSGFNYAEAFMVMKDVWA
ncbi:PIG-L family deacetylase [Candidatus Pseudothioglobus singularis]|nr:PIG-L family deacetylase [Candidatus Pseudothioglobus singularis]